MAKSIPLPLHHGGEVHRLGREQATALSGNLQDGVDQAVHLAGRGADEFDGLRHLLQGGALRLGLDRRLAMVGGCAEIAADHRQTFFELASEAHYIDQRRPEVVADDVREPLDFLVRAAEVGCPVGDPPFQVGIECAHLFLGLQQFAGIGQGGPARGEDKGDHQDPADQAYGSEGAGVRKQGGGLARHPYVGGHDHPIGDDPQTVHELLAAVGVDDRQGPRPKPLARQADSLVQFGKFRRNQRRSVHQLAGSPFGREGVAELREFGGGLGMSLQIGLQIGGLAGEQIAALPGLGVLHDDQQPEGVQARDAGLAHPRRAAAGLVGQPQ